jgi:guanylate kinase
VTTRPLRRNEQQKKDYIFVSRQEFLRRERRGEFLETQVVFGHLYGTPKKFVRDTLRKKSVLLCIDVKGARAVKKICPESVMIFILPPSLKILQKRLTNRLTEGKKELRRRLKLAEKEMAYMRYYDYIVVNDQLKKATRQLGAIVIAEHCRRC